MRTVDGHLSPRAEFIPSGTIAYHANSAPGRDRGATAGVHGDAHASQYDQRRLCSH